jgi:hypothetical protein
LGQVPQAAQTMGHLTRFHLNQRLRSLSTPII